jgi:hypothetical protein
LAAAATGCCVSPPKQLSAPRTLYIDFRKAKLKKSQKEHGTVQVLRTRTLRVILMQFLDLAAVVCLQV